MFFVLIVLFSVLVSLFIVFLASLTIEKEPDLQIKFIGANNEFLFVNNDDQQNLYPCIDFQKKAIADESVFVECDGQMIQLDSSKKFAKEIFLKFGPSKQTSMNSEE